MKNLFKDWTVSRLLYLLAGIFFVLVAANDSVWFMIPFGLYFVAMSIFKFGCAGGNCEIPAKEAEKETR